MSRIDLPSGGWADLRDPLDIKKHERKRIMLMLDDVEGAMAQVDRSQDLTLAAAVSAWSFELPLPSLELDSCDMIPLADYDAILAAAAPIGDVLFRKTDFSPKVRDGALVEGSPI